MVGSKLYLNVFILDCKFLLAAEAVYIKLGIVAKELVICTVEALHLLIARTALLQDGTDMSLGQHTVHARLIADYLSLLGDNLMHRLHILGTEFLAVDLAYYSTEGIALLLCRDRSGRAEQALNEGVLQGIGIFSIIESSMYIRAAVVKGREHEACLGRTGNPVAVNGCKPALVIAVEETGLSQINRAYRSYQVLKGLVRGVGDSVSES